MTYSATIPACSGASAVGCKGVVKVSWFLFLFDSTILGELKLKAAAQDTLGLVLSPSTEHDV